MVNQELHVGTDGFTSEFYTFFWIDINLFLVDSLNFALEQNREVLSPFFQKKRQKQNFL